MNESTGERGPQQAETITQPGTQVRIILQEFYEAPPIRDYNAILPRKSWEETVAERLSQGQSMLIVFADLKGGRSLAERGILPRTMAKITQETNSFLRYWITKGRSGPSEKTTVDPGLAILRAREPGEDEILFAWQGFPLLDNELDQITAEMTLLLHQEIARSSLGPDQIYVGGCFIPRGTQASLGTVMRAASIALGEAKEKAKSRGDFSPVMIKLKEETGTHALGEKYQIAQPLSEPNVEEVIIPLGFTLFPKDLIIDDAVETLAQRAGAEETLIWAFTPKQMSRINQEQGWDKGDEALIAISESLLRLKREHPQATVLKIGTVIVCTGIDFSKPEAQPAIQEIKAKLESFHGLSFEPVNTKGLGQSQP